MLRTILFWVSCVQCTAKIPLNFLWWKRWVCAISFSLFFAPIVPFLVIETDRLFFIYFFFIHLLLKDVRRKRGKKGSVGTQMNTSAKGVLNFWKMFKYKKKNTCTHWEHLYSACNDHTIIMNCKYFGACYLNSASCLVPSV